MPIISFSHRKSLFNSYHGPLACGGGGGEEGSILQSHLLFLSFPQLKIFWTTLMLLTLCKTGLQTQWCIILRWNLINTVSNGPKKFGCINGVVLLTRVFLQDNVRRFLPCGQKKVAVITRWPYYRGGCKAGFDRTISHLCNPNQIHSRHNYGPGLALEVHEKYHRTPKFETKLKISMLL